MKTIQAIKHLSIRAYLAEQGLHPTKDNPRYGLYLSPLREEHTPSFKVDYVRNLWYDFGLGEGGSIIDLVMRLERCDFAPRRPIAEKQREGTDRCTPIFVAFIDRSRAPYPLRHTASSFGIARLFTAARYRSGGCLHLLSGDTLYDQWQKIFRHRISERCRRMGVALGMLQRKCIAQTDYDDRQPHRYGNRLRGVHGFSLLPFDEAPRPTTHRRNSIKLGRQSSESASVSRTPFDDSCFLRQ